MLTEIGNTMAVVTDSGGGGAGGDSGGNGAVSESGASSGKDAHLEAIKNKIEGPTPNQSLAEYLNRTHVSPLVRKCFLQKDHKVSRGGTV